MELVRQGKLYRSAQISDSTARDYGSTRGFANESEYTVVKVGV